MQTSEGFIVVEIDSAGKPTMRFWILSSDVDAAIVARTLSKGNPSFNYPVRRANVLMYSSK